MKNSLLEGGFTLIELLVVIAIIGLLASIMLPAFNAARARARDSRRIADLRTISTAIDAYVLDHNYLPRNSAGWCTYISNPNNNWGPDFQSDISPKYVKAVPLDPTKANQLGDYFYGNLDNGSRFTLCTNLEVSGTKASSYDWSYCEDTISYNYCIDYKF